MAKKSPAPKDQIVNVPIIKIFGNPFRDPTLAYDEAVVNALMEDIKATGIWPNIIARVTTKEGTYQIAYGHHRVEACIRLKLQTIPIIVRDLSDADMIRAMLAENAQEYKTMNVERALSDLGSAISFLTANPEYVAQELINPYVKDLKERKRSIARFRTNGPGKVILSRMLGWPESRVSTLLAYSKLPSRAELKKTPTLAQVTQDVRAARAAKRESKPKKAAKVGRPLLSGLKLELKILDLTTELMSLLERQKRKAVSKNFWWTVQYNLQVIHTLIYKKSKCELTPEDTDKVKAQVYNMIQASKPAKPRKKTAKKGKKKK